MTNMEAFHRLGIPMTKDLSEIKKAYQRLIPHNHPEENPEGFMHLHDAYKTAMAYAKGAGSPYVNTVSRQPENTRSAREETAYDSLFSNLEESSAVDISAARQEFSRKLRRLRLHWLPIPLKTWRNFFGSEAFLLCRGESTYLAELFDLMQRKIHPYGVFCFLISKLWELESWQISENRKALAEETNRCIRKLKDQYKYYEHMNAGNPVKRWLYPAFWYYQALPFYFKLLVSMIILPMVSLGSDTVLIWMLLIFYFLEFCTFIRKSIRNLGIFNPTPQRKNGVIHYKKRADNALLVLGTIYATAIHCAMCITFWDSFLG